MPATESHIPVFEKTLQTTHQWLRELERILHLRDQSEAYAVLRGVLHALRDRLIPDEAVDLGAQLPMLIRGFYYEGWKPNATPTRQRHLEGFLDAIPRLSPDVGGPEAAVRAVFGLLGQRITDGEVEDIRNMLPEEVRKLWPEI